MSAASDLTVGGPTLAAHAFDAGLVDERHLFVCPVLVGDGKPAFPDDTGVQLDLLEERQFDNGVVYLRYAPRSDLKDRRARGRPGDGGSQRRR
jgi:dihydrofolate reductase